MSDIIQQAEEELLSAAQAAKRDEINANSPWLGQAWRSGVNGGSGLPLVLVMCSGQSLVGASGHSLVAVICSRQPLTAGSGFRL
jgi:hypothetical protein